MTMQDAPRRRTVLVLLAALAVGAVLLGGTLLLQPGEGRDGARPEASGGPASAAPTGSSGTGPAAAAEGSIDLDLGLADAAAVTGCLDGLAGFATDPTAVQVRYGMQQRSATGSTPVLVLENADGDLLLCDAFGSDRPAQLPVPAASEDRPVAFLSSGRSAWDCDGDAVTGYTSSTWLAVSGAVARVEQRYVVDGAAGPWFTTAPHDGIAHLQTWLGPQPAGTALEVESRVLDAAGDPVPQSTLPAGPAPLTGCAGGDAQIG
ncbi:hypothetical protein [Nocardioides mesophilus]|uniref:Uncharacterized protein n=1 Tax=Nocardioides mesophilus TaxID=433659 RepID=A0A7G9REP3_9ACTN|nr:hypothetical protein [Nocardioides mesophilus]QNN54068.1 hypothetical protein H9L09_06735 [Nocardioides mesophilus]